MKMSESLMACEKCFDLVAKRDTNCARLWMNLCDIQNSTQGVFGLKTGDFPQLRTLELMRLIVTREVPDLILVRLRVHHHSDDYDYFCGGACGE